MKKYINILFPNVRTCKNAWSKKNLTIRQRARPDKYCCGLMFSTCLTINHLICRSHYTWKALKKENCTPSPTQYMERCTECHRKYKIWSCGLSCADFERISQSDWVFPSSGSERSTNKPMENQLIRQKKMFLLLSVKVSTFYYYFHRHT